MSDVLYIVNSGFYDSIDEDRLYSADEMNKPYQDILSEGIFPDCFAATPGVNLRVKVSAGRALLHGKWIDAEEQTLVVPANDSVNTRIDAVVLRVDNNPSARWAAITYRTGTPLVTPEAPALDNDANVTEVRLANITVPSGASAIVAANIEDTRGGDDCDYVKFNVGEQQIETALLEIIEEHPELIVMVPDGGITTAKLATGAVTSEKLASSIFDPSLSVAGKIADAKKVGDELSDLKSDLDELSDNIFQQENMGDSFTLAIGYFWNTETSVAVKTLIADSYWMASSIIPVTEGEMYTVTGDQGATHKTRIWVLCDDSMNIIAKADDHYTTTEELATETFTVLEGATKLVLTTRYDAPSPYAWLYRFTIPLGLIDRKVLDTLFETKNITEYSLDIGYFWNTETSVAVKTELSGSVWMASSVIRVSEGEKYTITADQGATHKTRIWVLCDDEMNIISMADDHYTTTEELATETFIVPQGATKLVLTTRHDAPSPYAWLYQTVSALDIVNRKPLKGLNLSLLGDSISAYAGEIPSGYDAYYPANGVSDPLQMWWNVLCVETGMNPLVINAWSGSAVTQLEDVAHSYKTPMSSDTRCSALNDGAVNPDIVLIAGGVNDYTYAESAQSEPLAWDGKTAPTLGDSFTEAYACMIKKIQTNYPNAIVVALSTWFTMRGTDNGYTLTHTVGQNVYTQQDYNDKIKYVAEQMHIPYIDVSNIGFNRSNFYPTYAQDDATIPTHPNATGHKVMGEAIAQKLPELVKGFFE